MFKRIKTWLQVLQSSIYETRYLTIPLLLIALLCFYLWKYSSRFADFGLNAFTETLGIIFTILVVDQLIRNQEFKKSLPLRAAAYEDVRMLVTRIVYFWQEAYQQSVPRATPKTVADLFKAESFDDIGRYLDLDSKPNVTPARTWWQHLPEAQRDWISKGERILERHAVSLDPLAYSLVHNITVEQFPPELLTGMRAADAEMGFPRPHNLGSYFAVLDNYRSSVLPLYDWCIREKALLERYGLIIKKSVPESLTHRDAIPSPPCMISPERLQEQLDAVAQFRQNFAELKKQS
jgi:hypothetical protein